MDTYETLAKLVFAFQNVKQCCNCGKSIFPDITDKNQTLTVSIRAHHNPDTDDYLCNECYEKLYNERGNKMEILRAKNAQDIMHKLEIEDDTDYKHEILHLAMSAIRSAALQGKTFTNITLPTNKRNLNLRLVKELDLLKYKTTLIESKGGDSITIFWENENET